MIASKRNASGSAGLVLTFVILLLGFMPTGSLHAAGRESALSSLLDKLSPAQELLPPEEAFQFSARLLDRSTVEVSWRIAPGYYLYRDKFAFTLEKTQGVSLGRFELPHGLPHEDAEYGSVEIFRDDLGLTLPLDGQLGSDQAIAFTASFQGCADRGVCYPPMTQTVRLESRGVPIASAETAHSNDPEVPVMGECSARAAEGFVETEGLSEQCSVFKALKEKPLWPTLLSFLGMGLLLAFTPCVFPMIPILSGIIVGQGAGMTWARGLMLSLSYVVSSALTYMAFGIVAGLFGENLQTHFQEPWVISAFSALFVILALSMFGLFNFEMPQAVQGHVTGISRRLHGGTFTGAAMMGALSTLIVGPCVAAPLAGTLIYIGETGDAILGGAALFSLGIGMGMPLLVIGASAGKLLPKAGMWMESVKRVFGVGLLATAIWLMSRILDGALVMALSGTFLITLAVYLGAFDVVMTDSKGWARFFKGIGLCVFMYGVLILVGLAQGQRDPLFPLKSTSTVRSPEEVVPAFRKITSVHELEQVLADARRRGRPLLLDFYADWCISCKEMERDTFGDPQVASMLQGFDLVRADVTANSEDDRELLHRFHLVGPPGVIIFGRDGQELRERRVIGYLEAKGFLAVLKGVLQQ